MHSYGYRLAGIPRTGQAGVLGQSENTGEGRLRPRGAGERGASAGAGARLGTERSVPAFSRPLAGTKGGLREKCGLAAVWLFLAGAAAAQTAGPAVGGAASQSAEKPAGFPWQNETLHYTMNWQSGLPVGDVYFTARKSDGGGWSFEVSGNAGVPGFAVNDKYRSSTAGADLCSTAFERETDHVGRKGREKSTFDQRAGTGLRVTLLPEGGGQSDFFIGTCARDAVAYSYFARLELGQGRVPASAQTYLGAAYATSMVYTGAQDIPVGNKNVTTDHLNVAVKGPKADFHFEVFYARDAARTPLKIRVPLSMGTFTLDLAR